MLAVYMSVDIARTDAKALCKLRLQAARVKNGAGADDLMLGKSGGLGKHVGQNVYGVGNNDVNGVRRGLNDLRRDVPKDLNVCLCQLQPRLAGLARQAGGDDHDVGGCRCAVIAGAHDSGGAEGRALIDVQRFAKGLFLVDVDQDDLRCDPLDHEVVCDGSADASGADHGDLAHYDLSLSLYLAHANSIHFYRITRMKNCQ